MYIILKRNYFKLIKFIPSFCFRYVHSRHLQVLDELNLTVEAMLMPDKSSPTGGPGGSLHPEELLSPASYSIDSGFSGSSSGTNSLGRNTANSLGRTANSLDKSSPCQSGKKIPHRLWNRLPSISKSTSQINALPKPSHGKSSIFPLPLQFWPSMDHVKHFFK